MILTTAEESRKLDRLAMEKYGLPEEVLMENAGAAAVSLMADEISWEGASVTVLCGTGNNGGDGFVIARYAEEAGADAVILLVGDPAHMGASAERYYVLAEKMGIQVIRVSSAAEADAWFRDASVIVDALIGTGLTGVVTGEKAEIITCMNDSEAVIVSVDVPSGLITDTGTAAGAVVDADYTVALGSVKRGHVLYPGSEYCGRILYSTIGIPDCAREEIGCRTHFMEAEEAEELLPLRPRNSHKGKNGHVGIFAGSDGMAGAALLASQGALYAGAGKVSLTTVPAAASQLAGLVPEVMVSAISGNDPYFTSRGVKEAVEKAAQYDAVAVGCGIGRDPETCRFVSSFLHSVSGTVVADADALYAMAARPECGRDCPGTLIMTPHVGEFSLLTGMEAGEIERDRIEAARAYAAGHETVLLLKGVPTVTALPDGTVWVNSTGNPGMASGGMGDTLTGIIAALAAQGMEPGPAAAVGAYLHGAAADILEEREGIGFSATDVARRIPEARKRVYGH